MITQLPRQRALSWHSCTLIGARRRQPKIASQLHYNSILTTHFRIPQPQIIEFSEQLILQFTIQLKIRPNFDNFDRQNLKNCYQISSSPQYINHYYIPFSPAASGVGFSCAATADYASVSLFTF